MENNQDKPLVFHKSFNDLLDTFRNVITGMTWLKVSIKDAKLFYERPNEIIGLTCSVTHKTIKVSKDILSMIEKEGLEQPALFNQTLINFYRVFTIAVKDIICEEADFSQLLDKPELQFLKHLRNASAHNNRFYWGRAGQQRKNTIKGLPVIWRGKEINETLENTPLYMNFLMPGDIFLLLSDISALSK